MPARLAHRLRTLERTRGRWATCSTCGKEGRWVVSYVKENEPTPETSGCPECGRAFHVIVREVVPLPPAETADQGMA